MRVAASGRGAPPGFYIETHKGGFTHQLYEFSTFYKLGVSLGYSYLHAPFRSVRSSPGVFEMLGFNEYLLPPRRAHRVGQALRRRLSRVVDIGLNDRILEQAGVRSLSELQDYVRRRVEQRSGGRWPVVVRFRWARAKASRHFFGWVNEAMEELPNGLDLRDAYFRLGVGRSLTLPNEDAGLKVLVHIRQGDTAVIPTPWRTFIPQTGPHAFKEVASIEGPEFKRGLEVSDYFGFVSHFLASLDAASVGTLVCSDGYGLGITRVCRDAHRIPLDAGQVERLEAKARSMDVEQFRAFAELAGVSCAIGENDENLAQLIHAALVSDVIIIGDHQMLIPKLLAVYHNSKNPPVLIAIHRSDEPPNFKQNVGLTASKAYVIPVHFDDRNNVPAVSEQTQAFLRGRSSSVTRSAITQMWEG